MIKPEEKSVLIQYRIEQAKSTIPEIEILINNNLLKVAVNRIYYGMFYILLALALKHNYKTSRHSQLIGWFNATFIKTGKIDKQFGKIIHIAFENRTDVDYGVFIDFTHEDVRQKYREMREFILFMENYIISEI
jgi:uncharacterized protein (UPF0332 family)